MADYGPRCTRRKQPNPRRKNEASGRVGRVKICFEEKYREIKIEKMPDEDIVSHLGSKDTLNSPNHSEPVGDEDDEERDNRLSDTLLSHSNPSSPENNTETTSTCLQNGALSQNSTNKTDDKLLESSMAAVENGYQTKLGGRDKISDDKSEEEKIQEYLRRSDTAVIYPEPVESELDRPPSGSVIHDSTEKVEGEPDLRCPYCEKSFTRLLQLREHMTTTHREHEGNHSCPKCSASFLNRSHLDKHLALHSPNSQICKICNKTFANVYRLQRHMISHDESAVLRKFKCPECEKAFKFKHHLKEHIRIHSGEKPFACPNCGKRFSHSGSYSSHMTSKKCLVMNLKVRRAEKPRVRRNGEQGLRPIAPKFDGVGEMDLSVSSYPEQCLDFPRHFVPPFASTPINTLLTNHFQTAGLGSAFRPLPALLDSAGYRLKGVSIEQHEMQPRISFSLALDKDNNSSGSRKNELLTTALNIKKEEDDGLTKGNKDLNAVKKILAIVDATISKQQQEANMAKLKNGLIQDALHTHSRIKQDNSSADEASNSSSAKADSSRTERSACRFCRENFESRIDLHQHERYLCKLNKEIFQVAVYNGDAIKEEMAASLKLGQNGLQGSDLDSDDNDSNRDSVDDEVYTSDGKKMRVRSLINEEHLRILKAHYEMNPRPKKYELVRIGREIGFSKRVVQVWFQNMRARDRKKGRAIHVPYFPPGENITTLKPYGLPPPVNPSPFSPILSSFNGGVPTHHTLPISLYYASPPSARFAHTNVAISPPYVSSPYTPPPPLALPGPEEDQPLDLSLKNKGRGPVSIINVSSGYPQLYASSHLQDCDETDCTVLNLSQKSRASSPTESNNNNPKTQLMSQNNNTDNKLCKSEAKLEHSILYKYMQKEGLIVNERTRENLARKDMVEANIDSTMQDLNFCTTNNNEPCSSVELVPKSETFAFSPLPRTSTPDKVQLSSHVTIEEITSSSGENSHGPYDSDLTNTSQDPIEISQSGNKIKRARKKSWRQDSRMVESEEFQLDLDESSSVDGEKPTKRRKSWKQHKVDIDEGMYACDQCDKMFSKQSSLARHKYEHSGQRPHKCDVCGKAFKHKHHLTEHKRLHSGEKPFQCKKCLKRFSHSGSYSQHMNHRYSYCKPYRE